MEKDEFPVFMVDYRQEIADRRIDKIKEEYESKGYAVLTNSNFNAGVDVIVVEKVTGRIVVAIESTNFRDEKMWMGKEKLDRYIKSLNWFDVFPDVRKLLYVSYAENIREEKEQKMDRELDRLVESGIELIICGKQD